MNDAIKAEVPVLVAHICRDFMKEKDLSGEIQRSELPEKAPIILDYFLRHSLIERDEEIDFDNGFRLWVSVLAALSTDFEIERLHKEILLIRGLSEGEINARGFLGGLDKQRDSIGLLRLWFEGKKKRNRERKDVH